MSTTSARPPATRRRAIRRTLAAIDGFLALTTVAGGLGLLTGAVAPPVAMLAGSPFRGYTVPGLALLAVVGGAAATATVLVLRRHRWGAAASALAAATIVGFEVVEVAVIGSPPGVARNLQLFYVAVGLAIGGLAWVLRRAERPPAPSTVDHTPITR